MGKEHVPEDDGLFFERGSWDLEQTVLYLYFFLSISTTDKGGKGSERTRNVTVSM